MGSISSTEQCKRKIFFMLWSDMAIEQSINRDCGALGGLTGLKANRAAMERWFLTSHNI